MLSLLLAACSSDEPAPVGPYATLKFSANDITISADEQDVVADISCTENYKTWTNWGLRHYVLTMSLYRSAILLKIAPMMKNR